jgi:predicted amidohydrolase
MQKASGTTIGVIHGLIELGKFDQNIQKVEEISERARSEGVDILVLPSMINGIPIFELKKNLRIKRSAETIPGRTTEYLASIANKYNLYIVPGPILERRGSKIYRSVVAIDPAMNIKAVISQISTPSGYGQGSVPPIIFVKDISMGIFIAEDIHLPELVLLMKFTGINIALFYSYPYTSLDKIISILKARAIELKVMVVSVGCTVKRKDEEVLFIPTTIIDDNGVVVHEVLDKSVKMIKITISNPQNREPIAMTSAYRKLLKTLRKALTYYAKNV